MSARLPGSLRARVTLGAVSALAGALLVLTVLLLAAVERDGRGAVDDALRERAGTLVGSGPSRPGFGPRRGLGGRARFGPRRGPGPRGPEALLAGSGTFVQVATREETVQQGGDLPTDPPPVPMRPGLATIDIGGAPWRSLTVSGAAGDGLRLQLVQSLAAVDERVADTRRTVLVLGALALLFCAVAVYALTGVATRPLARLRDAAAAVESTDDLSTPLGVRGGPDEVRELGASLDAMLARLDGSAAALQQALASTKRFAADAGHELRTPLTSLRANVDVLRRNPALPAAERDEVLAEIATEQERSVHLLDGLTALARGEAADALPREPVELADLVDSSLGTARRRYPGVSWTLLEDVGEATVHGWPDGLRLMIDNLLANAALHGREEGRVEVALDAREDALVLRVDDDGPGIPVGEREAVLEPFRRGGSPRSEGTGLGLAIVAQQAALHGGTLTLETSPLGGLRAMCTLAR